MEQGSQLLVGLAIGLSVSAPIGPMGLLCINRTLSHGATTGMCTGAAASTVQVIYCGMALLGFREAQPWIEAHGWLLGIASAASMVWFASRLLRPRRAVVAKSGRGVSLLAAYASAFALGVANPMTPVLLLGAISALLGPNTPGGPETITLLGGVFLGSFTWWVCLSNGVAMLRGRLGTRALARVDQVAALALLGFSLIAVLRAAKI